MRQVSVSSSNNNGRNGSRPTSAAQRQPSTAVVEMHDSDFASSSSSDDEDSAVKPFVVNTAKGTVTGGMLGGDDSSSSSSSESSSDSSTDDEEEGSHRRQQPPPARSAQQPQPKQQQQQTFMPPSSSSSSSRSSSAATSPTNSRHNPPQQQQQQQPIVPPPEASRAPEPTYSSFNRPGFNRLESEFTYGDPVEEKTARLAIQPTPPQSRPSNQITSPRANSVAAAATASAPIPSTASPRFTSSSSSTAAATSAYVVADDVALNLPPLDSFDSGIFDTCELCDENQARVYCVECNMRFCWGPSIATGAIEGCVLDMHRNEERRGHQRYEWTDKGQGKFIQFEADAPIPTVAPVIRSNASSRQSSRPPSAAHSHSHVVSKQQQQQQQPTQAKKVISRSSSSTASVVEEQQPPLKQVTESPKPKMSSQGQTALQYLPVPPPITDYTSSIPDMCDLCDEHEARIYCEECDMKLCWGTSENANGSYNSSSSSSIAQQHIIGCVVDMHRNAEVLSHHRYEWKDGSRGLLLPFQQQLPETPKADFNRVVSVHQQQYEEAKEKTELLRQQSSQLVTELAEHDRPHEPQPIYEAPEAAPEPFYSHHPAPSSSSSSSSSSIAHAPPSAIQTTSSSSRPTSAARSRPSRPSTATLRSLAPADAALLDAVTSDPASWSSLQVCNWLTTLSPSYFSLHGIFLSMGVTGTMLLNLTDSQLQEELYVQDFNIRKKILDGIQVLKVKSRSVVGSISSVALVSANGRPFPTELHQAAQATLEARGFQPTDEEDDMSSGEVQSPQSNAVPYTRAQLMFMLGERNRLIAHLTSENDELKQKIIELSTQR